MEEQDKTLYELMDSCYLKFKLNFYCNLFRQDGLGKEGLTVVENFCAEAIYALDGPTINELARFIQVSQPNAAYKVNSLEEKGYIEKIQSKADRRECHLYVTEKFKRHYLVNYEFIERVTQELVDQLPEETLCRMKMALEVMDQGLLNEVYQEMNREYGCRL
ncbi:MAG: MarR family transcriptional regulator [Tissierellia bacterium]|nr:MarR family transcriptional regulator [Tissierellia bacterium]